MEPTQTGTFERLKGDQLKQQVYKTALQMYQTTPDWVTFFREILGINGIVRRLFPDERSLAAFEKTPEFAEIQLMISRLRRGSATARDEYEEPTRMITVRLPKSLHEALRAEAFLHQTSMNKLCITKLLQIVDDEINPRKMPRWSPTAGQEPPKTDRETDEQET